jgi:hypothetical protein
MTEGRNWATADSDDRRDNGALDASRYARRVGASELLQRPVEWTKSPLQAL